MASKKETTSSSTVGNAALAALGSLNSTVDFVRQTWAGMGLPTALAPTVDVAELEKKITDLKAVEQWLEINQSLLRTSIQTLEVQRNTIAAVQAFGNTLKKDGKDSEKSTLPGIESMMPGVDTQAWWNLLQGQFNQIAQSALGSDSKSSLKSNMTQAAKKMATQVATQAAGKVAAGVAASAVKAMTKPAKPRRKRV
jgi:hypothetical protein